MRHERLCEGGDSHHLVISFEDVRIVTKASYLPPAMPKCLPSRHAEHIDCQCVTRRAGHLSSLTRIVAVIHRARVHGPGNSPMARRGAASVQDALGTNQRPLARGRQVSAGFFTCVHAEQRRFFARKESSRHEPQGF